MVPELSVNRNTLCVHSVQTAERGNKSSAGKDNGPAERFSTAHLIKLIINMPASSIESQSISYWLQLISDIIFYSSLVHKGHSASLVDNRDRSILSCRKTLEWNRTLQTWLKIKERNNSLITESGSLLNQLRNPVFHQQKHSDKGRIGILTWPSGRKANLRLSPNEIK